MEGSSFIEDKKRRHGDASGLPRWIRILPVEQAEVDNDVGVESAQLKEDRKR